MSNSNTNLEKSVAELKAMVTEQNKRIAELIKHVKEGCNTEVPQVPKWSPRDLNPFIECLNPDILHHLGLDTETTDFPSCFGDVRFICVGSTDARMESFANFIVSEIGLKLNKAIKLRNIAGNGQQFAMYKVGPVLCASHGIGRPSISILLNELIKLVFHAKCQDPVFIRMGTSSGVGIEPGTVVITSEPLDSQLRPSHEVVVHTEPQLRPALLDQNLAIELRSLSHPCQDGYDTIMGKTLCTDDFYEGQSRLDNAFCNYKPEDKTAYLKQLFQLGIANMEMEGSAFAALTHQANIRAAVVTVAILDCFEDDQIKTPEARLQEWDRRVQILIARYMRKALYGIRPDDEMSGLKCSCGQQEPCCGV